MKKIYLLILLVVSMSFAGVKVVGPGLYEVNYQKASFKITNKGGSKVSGFKVTAYITACGYSKGLTIPEDLLQLQGGKITSTTRLSAHLFKVDIDFSKQTIPANGTFPSNGKYVEMALRNNAGGKFCSARVTSPGSSTTQGDYEQTNYVVKNLSGKVLWGKAVSDEGNKRVGVLYNGQSAYSSCGTSIDKENTITLNSDGNNPKTGVTSGNTNPPGIYIPGNKKTITFSFCYESSVPRVNYDYIVLKMDKKCPDGTIEFARHHDTEDGKKNSYTGDVWPNVIDGNATLYFCFVPKDASSKLRYPYAKEYGVFANRNVTNILYSEILVDDEHSNNKNKWPGWDDLSSDVQKRIRKIMSGTNKTTYFTIMWNGLSLSKSADAAFANNISAETPLVAAMPLAPAIKGLNRSAVAVELKSEGDVKVSIVNVNGSVVANIARENLQAGIHQIKWNAGMVPSGRYVVKIEQNGMVNAKNVILK